MIRNRPAPIWRRAALLLALSLVPPFVPSGSAEAQRPTERPLSGRPATNTEGTATERGALGSRTIFSVPSVPQAEAVGVDIELTKSHARRFAVGTISTYTFVVVNTGDATTTGPITITDNLPTGLTFASASGGGWNCGAAGALVTCTRPGALAPGEATSFALNVSVAQSAFPSVTNAATASTPDESAALLGNNTSSDVTQVILSGNNDPFIDLLLSKSHAGNFTAGQNGVYTIVVVNLGDRMTVGDLTLTDNLPVGLTFVSAVGTGWSCSAVGQQVNCSNPIRLAQSQSTSLSLTVAVSPTAPSTLTNTATVSTPNEQAGRLANNTDTDPTTIDPVPALDLAIVKTATGPFAVGQNAAYQLTVNNLSSSATTGATTITDVLPAGLTFVSAAGTGWICSFASGTVSCTYAAAIAAGASTTVLVTVAVGASAVPSVTNTATVQTPGDGNPGNNTSTIVTPVTLLDVAIAKSHTGSFTVGQNGTYTLTVSNVGNVATTGPLTVTDNLPTGLTFVSASGTGWSCSATGPVVTCGNPATFAPGATIPAITLTVGVSAAAIPSVTNLVTVATPGDAVPGNNTATDPTTVNAPPALDLELVKTATTPFVVGQNATYLLTVNNVSQAPTSGTTTITDVLPAGLGFVSAAGTGWTCGFASGTVTCTNPAVIAAGASSSVTVTVAVAAAAVPSVTNTGTVQSPGDSNPGNNDSTITTPVQVLDVAIAKSHTGNFVVGQNGSYTLTVTNVGNLATTGGLTVTDNLPAGLAFVSASGTGWSCSASGSAVTCANPATFAPGAAIPAITLTVSVSITAVPSVTNVATVATPGDQVPGNNTASDPTTVSTTLDVAITKIHSGNFTVGQNGAYTLRVTNAGSSSTTGGLTVTDNLPNGLSFVSATGTGWTCSALGAVVTCTNPATLPPGGAAPSITLTVAVSSAAVPSVTNVAIVSTPGDSNPTNNIARDPTIVSEPSPSLDLAIQKSASPGAFIVGQNGTYLLNVTNISSIPTTGTTTVTDILASGLTYVSATGSGWSCSVTGQAISCTTGTPIAPGATTVITVTVAVGPAAAPGVRNTGIVKTPGDTIPANDTSTVTTPVGTGGNQIDLEILKTSSSLVQGQQGTFTLTITNLLDPTSKPTTITDVIPAGLTYVSATGPGFTCSAVGQTLTCTYAASLAHLETATVTVTVNVTGAVGTVITNTGVVKNPDDINPTNDTSTITETITGTPDLAMDKEIVQPLIFGRNATFTLTVTNVGNGATTGLITVTDQLPAGFTYVSASGIGWTCSASGQLVTCTNPGPLAPKASSVITLVTTTPPQQINTENTAVVKTPGDPNPGNDSDTVPIGGGTPQIDLETTKSASSTAFSVGQPASYTIIVRNISGVPTTVPITVTDAVPAQLTLVSASGTGWTCSISGQLLTCTYAGILQPGAAAVVTVNVIPLPAAIPSVRNIAVGTSPEDFNPANDTSTVNTPVGGVVDLSLQKESVGAFQIGQTGRYNLTIRNTGSIAAAAPITVRDTLPAGLTFVSATGTGWACSVSGSIVTCIRSTALAAGETSTIELQVTVGALAIPQVSNCATVSGTNETGTLANNQGCATTPVAGRPTLEITKSVSKADAQIGDVLDYTVVVRNTGTANLANAIVVDTLPLGFAYEGRTARVGGVVIADPAGAPGPRLTFAIGAVNVGTPVTLTYRVRIAATAKLGVNTNVAVASSSDGGTTSGPARASTRLTGGLFNERGAIVGKVYTQCNCESAMQEGGEVGIPGVRIYLEDGSSVVTDVEGKYNFYGVSNRMHTVKVDRSTLPGGAVLVPLGNRNAMDGYSRFADVKGGEMHKADFAEGSGSADVLRLVLERRRAGEVENAGTQIKDGALPPRVATEGTPPARSASGQPLPAATVADSIKIAYTTMAPGVAQSHDSGTGPVRAAQGYQPLVGGTNTLTDANSQLPATPLRALAAQQSRNPFGYGRVQLEVPQQGIPADGQTLVKVVVRALDGSGNPLTGRIPVTLEASLGRWLGDDVGATEQGRQVVLDGGEGSYTLIAAAQPGRGEVRVTTPDGVSTMPISFIPVVRPLMASGLLNARIDFRSLIRGGNALASDADGFEESMRDWTFENDSGKVRGGARGALLLKGQIFGDQLLTMSYDSERDRGATLFRDIRPDEFFPVYGDGSIREFDAQSRRKFYARLDRGTSFTMFGDFQTTRADERRILSAYDRTLNGAVQHFEGKQGTATLFASQGRIRQAVDELPGRGISGPYTLTRAQGLINSERVEIITRDRNQPSVILSRVALTRFADYTIEPLTGRLIFRAPVPSADANLNPVSIRVSYETESAGSDNFWVYGGDASVRVGDALEIGGTYAQDENPILKSRLAGLNATAKLGRASFLFGEFAQTDLGGTTGDAFRVELRHQSEKVEGRIFAARSDSAFTNTSSTFFGGRTEFGGRFSTRLDDKTRLMGDALHTENNTGLDGKRDGALIAIERQFDKAWRAEVGYRYAKESGNYSPYPGAGLTQINRGLVDNDVSALRGRLTWTLPEKTRSSIFTEYEQDIRDDSHRGAIGGEYIISNSTRLYARHEWLTGQEGPYATNSGTSQQYTVFGIDADYLKNTQMFSEYRGRDSFNGRDAEASIGLRNRWAVAPGLMVNTSFERVSPLIGVGLGTGQNAGGGDALAVTGGVEWTRPSLWKSTARLEYRDADSGDNFLASFGYARKLSLDWTFLGRTLWDVAEMGQNQTRGWSQLGFAWRETDQNKWNALMRYENRLTNLGSTAAVEQTENMAHILAALVNYQPQSRVTLSGRYAAKMARDDVGTLSTSTTSQLLMGRGLFDLNRRLDAGLISSVLMSDGFSSRRYGLGAELGLIVMKNLRVAGGYNVFGFTDKDLNSFGTTRKGLYLDLGFKFDESLFGLGAGAAPCDNACRAGGKDE
ncbi:MAG: DUF11 domain-containing protein [Gemmatimonadaceae bacterium]|nr:DUF11 domain-containing protein [Gemmatimonadaceae bacterium]